MARNQELVALGADWQELTNADTSAVLLQVQHGRGEFRATVGATPPGATDHGVILEGSERMREGEWQLDLAADFHLSGANRLYGRRAGTVSCKVLIGHA